MTHNPFMKIMTLSCRCLHQEIGWKRCVNASQQLGLSIKWECQGPQIINLIQLKDNGFIICFFSEKCWLAKLIEVNNSIRVSRYKTRNTHNASKRCYNLCKHMYTNLIYLFAYFIFHEQFNTDFLNLGICLLCCQGQQYPLTVNKIGYVWPLSRKINII